MFEDLKDYILRPRMDENGQPIDPNYPEESEETKDVVSDDEMDTTNFDASTARSGLFDYIDEMER